MKINSFIFSLFIALVSFSALSAPPPRPPKPLPPPNSVKFAKVISFENSAQEPLARQCANIGVGSYIGYSPSYKVIPLRKILPNGINCIAIEIGPSASVVYTRNSVQQRIWFSWEFKEECPENQKFNPLSGLCEVPCDYGMNDDGTCKNKCDFGFEVGHTKTLYWHPMATGNDVQYGCYYTGGINAEYCTMKQSGETEVTCEGVIDGHITANTRCRTEFSYTGSKCSEGDKPFWGDGEAKPDPDIDPDTDTNDPEHKPDDPTGGDIVDPSVLPDSDSDVVVPDKPGGKPDVEDPDIEPGTDKAVVNAVVGLNKDVNKALNDLHIDINRNKADIQNEMRTLNASVVTNTQAVQKQQINDNEIYRKTKALIQQANSDITTSVNKNTGAINSVGEDVEKIAGSMEGIAEDVAGISETLDGIANTDTSGAGIGGTCIQVGNCRGFYNSGYPQGLNGLVSGQLENLKNNTIDKFVNSFGKMDLSNAKRPSFVLPVPFFGDFSFEAYINFDWIFGFVRACLIMTSIFAARRIIFGG